MYLFFNTKSALRTYEPTLKVNYKNFDPLFLFIQFQKENQKKMPQKFLTQLWFLKVRLSPKMNQEKQMWRHRGQKLLKLCHFSVLKKPDSWRLS